MSDTITIKLNPIMVPKPEFTYCDVAGIDCQRIYCCGCEFGKNPKRMKMLEDKNNLREMTKEEYNCHWFCITHRGEGL